MPPSSYLICFLASAALSLLFTRWVRNFATARGWVNAPGLDRHVHTRPVPRLGGVAIYAAFMLVAVVALAVPKWIGLNSPILAKSAFGILGPALIILILGLYDDLRSIGPYWKFGIQILAAVWLYLAGFGIHQVDLISAGHVLRVVIGLPLTILWVLLITNAFNLIDGLDGLAAGSAFFSTIVVFVVSLLIPNPMVTLFTIVLAGAILGFLRFNFYPASIFLGDSGSMFIGFMLSALALAGSQKAPTMIAVAIPVVSFGLPILDVGLAVTRRFLGGKPLFCGDDDHIHHKLLKRGLSQREAVLILYGVTAAFALLSLVLLHNAELIALVLTVIGLGIWLGMHQLGYLEFSELQGLVRRTREQKRLMANNLEIRRAVESLNSCADLGTICTVLKNSFQPLGFDGFEIKNSLTDGLSGSVSAPLQYTSEGGLRFCWVHAIRSEPAWELRMDLSANSGYKTGYFSLLRTCGQDPLLLDINLLTNDFRASLSRAMHRAMNGAQEPSSELTRAERSSAAAKMASSSTSD